MARLRSKIAVEPIPTLTKAAIAGHFTSNSKELRRRVGSFLSGDDLYLFPDGTYLDSEWSDISPVTIRDKGAWSISGGELILASDKEVTWNPGTDRRYVLVRRHSHLQEIIAIGIGRDVSYFEQHAKDDPEFMLLIVGKMRSTRISQKASAALMKELMQRAWRPEFYRSE